jgi:hypothetical protein
MMSLAQRTEVVAVTATSGIPWHRMIHFATSRTCRAARESTSLIANDNEFTHCIGNHVSLPADVEEMSGHRIGDESTHRRSAVIRDQCADRVTGKFTTADELAIVVL